MKLASIVLSLSMLLGSTAVFACDENKVRLDIKANLERLWAPLVVSNFRITMLDNGIGVPKKTEYLVFFESGGKWIAGYDVKSCWPIFMGATNTTDESGNL